MSRKTLALLAAGLAAAGCTLNRSDVRRGAGADPSLIGRLGGGAGAGGQVIEPKRCTLSVVILTRPAHDRAVDEAVWASADEQVVAPEVRRVLQANGLKLGLITGGLPVDLDRAIHAPPPNKVERPEFSLPDGSNNTLISLTESLPETTLLLNREGRTSGRDYHDAKGFVRITATQDGPTGVTLRVAPEIHHGQVARRFTPLPDGVGTLNTMEPLAIKDAQDETTFRDLTATFTVQPGQAVVLGGDPDRPGSLGAFLFTQPEPKSDRLLQKVVVVWASRNNNGIPGSHPVPPTPRLTPVEPPDLPAAGG
jgi:hypothetical protein